MIRTPKEMATLCYEAFLKLPNKKRRILHCPVEGGRTAHNFCYHCERKKQPSAANKSSAGVTAA